MDDDDHKQLTSIGLLFDQAIASRTKIITHKNYHEDKPFSISLSIEIKMNKNKHFVIINTPILFILVIIFKVFWLQWNSKLKVFANHFKFNLTEFFFINTIACICDKQRMRWNKEMWNEKWVDVRKILSASWSYWQEFNEFMSASNSNNYYTIATIMHQSKKNLYKENQNL